MCELPLMHCNSINTILYADKIIYLNIMNFPNHIRGYYIFRVPWVFAQTIILVFDSLIGSRWTVDMAAAQTPRAIVEIEQRCHKRVLDVWARSCEEL